MNLFKHNIQFNYTTLFLIFIVIIAVWIRLKGLGTWPLALDEYYIVRSIQNILVKGIPEYDAGGYYTRSLIYQYSTAFLIWIGLKTEFASRILPVLFNILTIPALYILSKKITNNFGAVAVVFLFCFSVWEVELSRFARMYTMFQLFFVWHLLFLYKYLFEGKKYYYNRILLLSFISIFVYEGSIFIIMLSFLPLFWDNKDKEFKIQAFKKVLKPQYFIKLLITVVISVFAIAFIKYDFRNLNSVSLLPPELLDYISSIQRTSKIKLPTILLLNGFNDILWNILNLIFISINGAILFFIIKLKKLTLSSIVSISILLLLLVTNLLGLFLLSLIIFLLLNWIKVDKFDLKQGLILFLIIAFNISYWSFFLISNFDKIDLFAYNDILSVPMQLKYFWKTSINYPNLYEAFVLFRNTIPLLTYISFFIIACGILLLAIRYKESYSKLKFLVIIFLVLVLAVTIINTQYFDTRYFFFLYPVYLILFVSLLMIFTKLIFRNRKKLTKIAFVIFLFGFIIISEDHQAFHLINIDSQEINYRTNLEYTKKVHYYPRWDSRSAAELVNQLSNNSDIILTNDHISDFYLDRLDYIYRPYSRSDFKLESVNYGKNERWTNANLLYKYDDLDSMLNQENKNKWLIINKMWSIQELEQEEFFKKYSKYLHYQSCDSLTNLYKITNE